MSTQPRYMTVQEFTDFCIKVGTSTGYRFDGPMHPEDIVSNLVPIMEAVAAGMTEGFRRSYNVPTTHDLYTQHGQGENP